MALILAAQSWAVDRKNTRALMEMASKNNPAICLARKLGYEFCGYNDLYYDTQDIALFFGRQSGNIKTGNIQTKRVRGEPHPNIENVI